MRVNTSSETHTPSVKAAITSMDAGKRSGNLSRPSCRFFRHMLQYFRESSSPYSRKYCENAQARYPLARMRSTSL